MLAQKKGERRIPTSIKEKEYFKLEMSDCEVLNELLYVRNRLFVPTGEGDTLRT